MRLKKGLLYRSAALLLAALLLGGMSSANAHAPAGEVDIETRLPGAVHSAEIDVEKLARAQMPRIVRAIDPNKPVVALTFDDGPRVGTTDYILDALDQYGGAATFFVVGTQVDEAGGALLNRMIEMGCEIGNHSWDHAQLGRLSSAGLRRQMNATDELVEAYTGMLPTVFRPPYGEVTQAIRRAAERPVILWSLDTLDWKYKNEDYVVREVLDRVRSGDIVLLHDIHPTSARASKRIIRALSDRGWQLVTVTELLSMREAGIEAGSVYSSLKP